ncbi:MAG: 50S ribosomal protein L23 [bacterium]
MGSILKKPLITEKSQLATDKHQKYGFVVEKKATKTEIKAEIEKLYGVSVQTVNTMVYAGKAKSKYTKRGVFSGRTPAYKKAFVTLQEGESIDFFENV